MGINLPLRYLSEQRSAQLRSETERLWVYLTYFRRQGVVERKKLHPEGNQALHKGR